MRMCAAQSTKGINVDEETIRVDGIEHPCVVGHCEPSLAPLLGQGIQEANQADELLGQGHLNRVSRLVEDIQA